MKIGIDISQVIYGTGVSVYTDNLVKSLLKTDGNNEYILYGGSLRRYSELKNIVRYYHGTVCGSNAKKIEKRISEKLLPIPPKLADLVWNRWHIFPVENIIGAVDVFHSSDWTQPPAQKARLVTTIHDLSFLRWPELVPPKILAVQKRRLEWVKKEVAEIIAVSLATKEEIIELLKIPAERITVIHEGISDDVWKTKKGKSGNFFGQFGITKPYLVAFCSQSPRKNTPRLLKAFALFNRENSYQLVVIGEYPGRKNLPNVVFTGSLDRAVIPSLLAGAVALAYPSLYEGFGLPILEAFALSVPVVTSNVSSMPEIAGEAAILVNPEDPESIASGLTEAVTVGSRRMKLIENGQKRLKLFSWVNTARETLRVYEKVYKRNSC